MKLFVGILKKSIQVKATLLLSPGISQLQDGLLASKEAFVDMAESHRWLARCHIEEIYASQMVLFTQPGLAQL